MKRTDSAGAYVFRQGDHSDVAYMIESGRIQIVKEAEGSACPLKDLIAGDIFGEMGLVDEKPRSASAIARVDSMIAIISRDEFVDMLVRTPEKSMIFVRALFERLRHMNSLIPCDFHETLESNIARTERTVTLIPLSDRAALEVDQAGLKIEKFPFRIGRCSLVNERSVLDMNDLVLNDTPPFNISKNHLAIEYEGGGYVANDRGSFFGTVVNGQRIGGQRIEGHADLRLGPNELVLGQNAEAFCFRLTIE